MSGPSTLLFTDNHNALVELGQLAQQIVTASHIDANPQFITSVLAEGAMDIVAVALSDLTTWSDFLTTVSSTSIVLVVKTSDPLDDAELYGLGVDTVFNGDVSANVLFAWLQNKDRQVQNLKQIELGAQSAAQAANIAMTNSSELGRVIHFVESTFDLHSSYALASGIFQLLGTIGLKSSIDFRWGGGEEDTFNSDGGQVGDAEKLILQEFYNDGRIIDFGARTLVNYPKVSLLIKNMPIEDEESYGRIKDLLPIILGAVNEKLALLDQEKIMYANSCETVQVFNQFRTSTFKLARAQNDGNTRDIAELSAMTQDIFDRLPGLGLDEDQERYIESSLQGALDKIALSFQESATNTADLLMMIEDIKELSARLEIIAESFAPKAEEFEEEAEAKVERDDTEYDFDDDDIVLF